MAAPGSDCEHPSPSTKNVSETPQKVRQLLSDSIAETDQSTSTLESPDESDVPGLPVPCDATNKEAFFSRVETFTWAGMAFELSPLHCAKYGWTNVECDTLKCSSCQAFLCATLHPLLDINKYKERITVLQDSLKTAHEKFCFWPDSPCSDHFWALPLNEPVSLLHGMAERFKSLCLLDIQLPVLKQDDLKDMTIMEETISVLLQLVEDDLKCNTTDDSPVLKSSGDALSVHVSACILALSGWSAGPSSDLHQLPVITCSYCMRRVGLWSFQQIDAVSSANDPDNPVCGTSPRESKSELSVPTPPATSPRRMITRSQDAAQTQGTELHETSPLPVGARTRSRDAHSPILVDRGEPESVSPHQRNKRPVTRSMGQGDVPSSPQRKPKCPRLSSSTSSKAFDKVFPRMLPDLLSSSSVHVALAPASAVYFLSHMRLLNKNKSHGVAGKDTSRAYFNPVSQHRDWCPWIRRGLNQEDKPCSPVPEEQGLTTGSAEKTEPGWKAVLDVLLSLKGPSSPDEGLDSFKNRTKCFEYSDSGKSHVRYSWCHPLKILEVQHPEQKKQERNV